MASRIQLQVTEGPMQGRVVTCADDEQVTFGRAKECKKGELPRTDRFVSRRHFLLEISAPHLWVRDLGSGHGTFVNGTKCPAPSQPDTVGPRVELKDGDIIRAGETTLQVQLVPMAQAFHAPRAGRAEIGCPIEAQASQEGGHPAKPPSDARSQQSPRDGQPLASEDREPPPEPGEYDQGNEENCALRNGPAPAGADRLAQFPAQAPSSQKPATGGMLLRRASGPPEIKGFDIQNRLGRSGLGSTFLCRRHSSGMTTVVKVVRSCQPAGGRILDLLREALANLCDLRHEGIAKILDYGVADFGEDGWGFCLEMEHCEAGNVQHAADEKSGRLPSHEVFDIIHGSLHGLAQAHALRVIHGNIKPANILLGKTRDGWSARVSDFALRRILDQVLLTPETSECYYVQNLPFMPPEQARSSSLLSQAADVWSAAAVYYYLLTGRYPRELNQADDPHAVALNGRIVSIRERYTIVPRGLESLLKLIDDALVGVPEQRFPTALDMWERFQSIPRPPVVLVGRS